jgi:hypothetical protein
MGKKERNKIEGCCCDEDGLNKKRDHPAGR